MCTQQNNKNDKNKEDKLKTLHTVKNEYVYVCVFVRKEKKINKCFRVSQKAPVKI